MALTDAFGFIWNGTGDSTTRVADVDSLEFDTVDSETHEWSSEVTTNPVENGSPIADHIITQPDKIILTGMISNAPVLGLLTQFTEAAVMKVSGVNYVDQAYARLRELLENKVLVKIYTKYRTYENMVITSVSIPRTPDNGDAIVFTIQAISVRLVTSQKTTIPKGLGVISQSTSKDKSGASNSADSATQKRASITGDNGKSGSDKGLLEGGADGLGSLKTKVSNILSKYL